MNAIGFSLLVNTSYFLADVCIKLGSLQMNASRLIYVRSLFTVLFSGSWLLLSGEFIHPPQTSDMAWLILCSVLCAVGLYYYVKALQHLHFVNVAVIGIMGAFIHYGLGVWLNNDTLSFWFFIATGLSTLGILIQWKKTSAKKGLLEAIISAVCWGFGYALLSIPLANTSAEWATFVTEFSILLLAALALILNDSEFTLSKPPLNNKFIIGVAIFTILGSLLINVSYQLFSLNTLGFMQLAFFPYSLIAGYFLFKEKLNKWEWLGNSLVVLGLVLYFYFCE
ncbi:MAG: DMT family transporter [Bacteroidia bacterium]|jgi:drug/metabolite transporter (DMT)-like permease